MLEYEYRVEGQIYALSILSLTDSAVLRLQDGFRSKGVANRIARKYPTDKIITVRYDPQNPSLAVLNADVFNVNLVLNILIMLPVFIFLGFALFSLIF